VLTDASVEGVFLLRHTQKSKVESKSNANNECRQATAGYQIIFELAVALVIR